MSGLRFIQKIALLAIFTAAFVLPFLNLPAASAAQTGLSAQTGDYFQNLQNQQNALRTQIKEKEETLKKLQEQEKNLNNQIKTAQKKETTLKNQINQFDQRIQKLAVDIEITETKISQHQLRIRELNLEIKRSEEIIQRNKKNLAELVRTIQSYDHANLLEILLRNKNFSDFLSQTERVQQLQRETQKRLEEIKLAKLKLGGEKTETESEKAELERLTQELDGQKAAAEIKNC
ncbi:MAG: Peptidase M23 [Candidatus Azambacteria bacterium GW2011_GWE2_46_45]|uniref:Peptidase M23 n=1 Tax=Candidatus Azambacteria bacterium GW2011_GWE2_46_45 TaxID=1618625 RepID=A0A0G1T3Q8_9BACT|nr:MAG: Peptidase M23 [Candidatus Azambacteria bacterium GW2011_GWE2_46_45]